MFNSRLRLHAGPALFVPRIHSTSLPLAPSARLRHRYIRPTASAAIQQHASSPDDSTKPAQSLTRPVAVIVVASILSKAVGLFRETVLASSFGLHPAYDAFGYSVLLPAFFLTIYGGLNGPIHQAATVAITQNANADRAAAFHALSSVVTRWSLGLSLILIAAAPAIVRLTAPGLLANGTMELAVSQLQCMAPVALFSGSLGLTGAALQARGSFLLPSLSPALTSVVIVGALLISQSALHLTTPQLSLVLAIAYTAGALTQAFVQRIALSDTLSPSSSSPPSSPAALATFNRLVKPALFASALTQLSVQLDLWVASFVAGACAAMGFANLLFMSVTGVISTALIGPLSSRLSTAASKSSRDFAQAIFSALDVALIATIPLAFIVAPVSLEITSLLFQRGSFSAVDCSVVATLLSLYLIGSVPYLLRDVAVRVFYASKSGHDVDFPTRLGWIGLAARLPLDCFLTFYMQMGAAGFVLSTTCINTGLALLSLVRLRPYLTQDEGIDSPPLGLRNLFTRALKYVTVAVVAASFAQLVYVYAHPFTTSLAVSQGGLMMFLARGSALGIYFTIALLLYGLAVWLLRSRER